MYFSSDKANRRHLLNYKLILWKVYRPKNKHSYDHGGFIWNSLFIYCLKHSAWKHKCNKIYSYHFITISKYNMGGGNLCFISQTFWSYKHVIILGKKLKWYQQADYSFLYSTGRGSMHSSSLFGFLIISPGIKGFFAQKT